MNQIITSLVLIIASYTDIKKRQISNLLTLFFFGTGLIYSYQLNDIKVKFLLIFLSLAFLYRDYWAPGDVKLYSGFLLWQPLKVQPWFLLFFSLVQLFLKILKKDNFPGAVLFLNSYLAVLFLFYIYPVSSQLPGLGIHTIFEFLLGRILN